MSGEEHRKTVRFRSDPNTIGWVSLDANTNADDFTADSVCLVDDESFDGCCIVLNRDLDLNVGLVLMIAIGEMRPVKSEVRWIRRCDEDIFKVGLQHIDQNL